MRVLLTGVDGFVGSHMAEFLVGLGGVEVFGTTISSEPGPNLESVRGRVRTFQADILDVGRVEELLATIRPDRVIHLAAQAFVPTSIHDPVGTFTTNITGSTRMLEALRRVRDREGFDPSCIVVSSSEVYGYVEPEKQPITEDLPFSPANPYAASKASVDLIAQAYRRTFGLKIIVARPFNHAGPRQAATFVCSEFGRRFSDFASGRSPAILRTGNIAARRDFMDVRDVVRAYWAMLESPSDQFIFNICSGTAHAISEIITMYKEISGIDASIVPQESKSRHYDTPVLVGSSAALRAATGWAPRIPLRQTLKDVFDYWQSHPDAP